jgi:hypothetical protein
VWPGSGLPIHANALGNLSGLDEAIWDRGRDGVTTNTFFGSGAKVREKVSQPSRELTNRTDEIERRYLTVLLAKAETLVVPAAVTLRYPAAV